MSESILKALMQLFAIIGNPSDDDTIRREVVRSFLKNLLNQKLAEEYLAIYDEYHNKHIEKNKDKGKRKKRISGSSVRVLKICTDINEELTQKQKIVVLIRLFEFVKNGSTISEQEEDFISTVADTFHIPTDEYFLIRNLIFEQDETKINSTNLLVINNEEGIETEFIRHIRSDFLDGKVLLIFIKSAGMYAFVYINGSELYLNGQLVQQGRAYVFNVGSSLRNSKIQPIYYSDVISTFNIDQLRTKIQFEVNNLEYKFKNNKHGLHPMSFTEESGHLVGIMGASGAGKSTLLNVLNGSYVPSSGEVLVNGFNVHHEKKQIEGVIGFVSQDDLLIEELTVFQNLYYNARLCFSHFDEAQLIETVIDMLESLGLYEIKEMVVGSPLNKKISGGQRKRLNIALELIREPSVLFLDEPTSGLSSRDSENIMDLLKELSQKGKLIIVVIHQPSSDIFKMFDRLLILDTGGYLIYNGAPIDSILYFKSLMEQADWNESECSQCGNVNPEQVFNIVESKVIDEYGNFTSQRKYTPIEWAQFFKDRKQEENSKEKQLKELPDISFRIPNKLKQFSVFVKRDVLSKLSNTQYMLINLLETPLLAFILSYLIKYYNVNVTNQFGYNFSENSNIPVYIFMSVIIAIFIGLTVSAEEIIKDRKIQKRERFLNLSRFSYLMSKIAILFVLSALLASIYTILGNSIVGIKGMYYEFWLVLFSTWCFANVLGLLISDSFKQAVTIYILIPFLVIPQIILSGVMVKFEKLNPSISTPTSIPVYGEIITARWAYEALAVYQFMENRYEREFYMYDKAMSIAEYKKNFWLKTIQNKIDICERSLTHPISDEKLLDAIDLIKLELKKENIDNPKLIYQNTADIQLEKLSSDLILQLRKHTKLLKRYYIKLYNTANNQKDAIINSYQKDPEQKAQFLQLKREYYNDELAKLVKNSNEMERIMEYKNELSQNIDPVFLDPKHNFIKAHFYAPQKKIFGIYFHTFWVNLLVIWSMTLFLFIALYLQWLKKLLDQIELLAERFQKKQE